MQIFKRAIAFILALVLMESLFTFLLEPVTFEHFLNYDEKQMKKEEKSVDMAFFGDSRAIRTFNPDIFEHVLSSELDYAINEGVNQQHLISTYYYMKDYIRNNKIKYAIVNLNYDYFLNTVEEPIEAKGLTFDRIHSMWGMAEFVEKRFKISEYPNILKSYRYRWQVKNIQDNIKRKTTKEYWQGIDVRDDIHYESKGYVTWNLAYEQGSTGTPAGVQSWNKDTLNKETLDYLDKMAKLCKDNGVKLYFVESPITIGRMYAINGYENFEQTILERCKALQVPFYNINLLKKDNVSFYDPNFTDTEHVNDNGSSITSKKLAEIIKREINGKDVRNMFFDSFSDMDDEYACIGACDMTVWDTDTEQEEILWDEVKDCTNVSGKLILKSDCFADPSIVPEYQFSISHDNGESFINLQQYSKDDTCEIIKADIDSQTILRVDVRPQTGLDRHHCYVQRLMTD